MLEVGSTEKFPHALGFQRLDPFFFFLFFFFRVGRHDPCFKAVAEEGGDKRLAQLELACKADGVANTLHHPQVV